MKTYNHTTGKEHHSPVKGTNKAGKMTKTEAKSAIVHLDATRKALGNNQQIMAASAQRRRALVRRINSI